MSQISKPSQNNSSFNSDGIIKSEIQHRKSEDKALLECIKQNGDVIEANKLRLEQEKKLTAEDRSKISQDIVNASERSSNLYCFNKIMSTIRDIGVAFACAFGLSYYLSHKDNPVNHEEINPSTDNNNLIAPDVEIIDAVQ